MVDEGAKIVNAEGSTMLEIKRVRVEDGRVVVTGALMGAWDTDMYMDVEEVKKVVGLVDIPQIIDFATTNVLNMKFSKADA